MPSKTPIQLLEDELKEFENSLKKSISCYQKGELDYYTHFTHKTNLHRNISLYKEAIYLLKIAKEDGTHEDSRTTM